MNLRIAAALMAAVTSVAGAQSGGPYGPLILLEPAGARTLAMGNVGVAGRDDDVLFYNPAQIAMARGTSGSFEQYSSHSWGGTLSTVTRLANSAIAIGAQQVDYRAPVDILDLVTPGGGSPTTLATVQFPHDRGSSLGPGSARGLSTELSAGYARTVKGVRVGGDAKFVQDQISDASNARGALDLGAALDLYRYYTIGLAVQNIGPTASAQCSGVADVAPECPAVVPGQSDGSTLRVYLPLRTTLGASFSHQLGEFDLLSTASLSMYRASWVSPAAGAELGYSWLDGYDIAIRAGLRRPLAGEDAFTAGAGFTMDRLTIDYALETLSGSRIGHRIGLRLR